MTYIVPHIGHLHSVVIADIFARYARIARPDSPVYFMTGTDEHGLKIQKAAQARGMDPLAFCDEISQHFRVGRSQSSYERTRSDVLSQVLADKANISHTKFSRTSEQAHHVAVQHLWVCNSRRGCTYTG